MNYTMNYELHNHDFECVCVYVSIWLVYEWRIAGGDCEREGWEERWCWMEEQSDWSWEQAEDGRDRCWSSSHVHSSSCTLEDTCEDHMIVM